MTVGVLALQGDVREQAAAFSELGAEVRPVRRPADLEGLSAIVLPGGESTALSLLLRSTGLADPLRQAVAEGLPTLGTCAGMILLAERVLDGRPDQVDLGAIDLSVRRNAYGHQAASFEADLDVPVLGPEPFHAVFIRAPVVEAVGPGVEVLATLPGTSAGVGGGTPVACRQGRVVVSAFHPELGPDRRLHRLFLDMAGGRREPPGTPPTRRPGAPEPGRTDSTAVPRRGKL